MNWVNVFSRVFGFLVFVSSTWLLMDTIGQMNQSCSYGLVFDLIRNYVGIMVGFVFFMGLVSFEPIINLFKKKREVK